MDENDQFYQQLEESRKDIMKKRLGGLFLVFDLALIAYIVFQIVMLVR